MIFAGQFLYIYMHVPYSLLESVILGYFYDLINPFSVFVFTCDDSHITYSQYGPVCCCCLLIIYSIIYGDGRMNKTKGRPRVCQLKYEISHTNSGFETPLPPVAIMKFACPETPNTGWPL